MPSLPLRRRRFLGAFAFASITPALARGTAPAPAASRPANPPRRRSFALEELTLADLQRGLRDGRWTSRRLTELYLDRIHDLDRRGPALQAIIETNPDALALARSLDDELRAGHLRGPLHGIPIVLKDNLDTADRMHTSAGSLALAESIAPRDAFVVERLRAAGAILLGKANLSEWANFRSSRSSSGWSARGGQCRNPYVLDRNPCGSSSGTATAVSANLAAAGVGTETDGSIVCPSGQCGLVGLKPTLGLLSRSGIIPIAASQDTAGPMTRTVADAALLLGVMAGVDPRDPATRASAGRSVADYTLFLQADGLRGVRLGVARRLFGSDPRVLQLMEETIAALRAGGAECVDLDQPSESGPLGSAEMTVLLHEFKAGLDAYLDGLGPAAAVRSLAELIAFNQRQADREMPWFGQDLFEKAQACGPLTDPVYLEARATCLRLARNEGIDAALEAHRLDALVAPTNGPAWVTDWVNGDHFGVGSSTLAAVAGYPNLTVPAGIVHGLPVGVSFFGRAWSEPTLLRIGYAFEQRTRARQTPRFLPTLPG
jgi:amidase